MNPSEYPTPTAFVIAAPITAGGIARTLRDAAAVCDTVTLSRDAAIAIAETFERGGDTAMEHANNVEALLEHASEREDELSAAMREFAQDLNVMAARFAALIDATT